MAFDKTAWVVGKIKDEILGKRISDPSTFGKKGR